MRFGLSAEQKLLDNEFSRWLQSSHDINKLREYCNIAPLQRTTQDTAHYAEFAQMGGTGILLSEDLGGSQLGLLEASLIAHRVGEVCYPVSMFSSVIAAYLINNSNLGSFEQLGQKIVDGSCIMAIGSSSNTLSSVVLNNDKISGIIGMVNDVYTATDLLVFLPEGIYYAPLYDTKLYSAQPLRTIDNTRSVGALQVDNLPVQSIDIDADKVNQVLALCLGAESLGVADAMLKKAVDWTLEREQFGQVIGSFQAVKHLCAEMAAAIEPCRALMWYSGYALDQQQDDAGYTAYLFKAHMSDVAHMVARKSTEAHGGMGFTDLSGLHYWFKRVGLNRQWFANATMCREKAAKLQGL